MGIHSSKEYPDVFWSQTDTDRDSQGAQEEELNHQHDSPGGPASHKEWDVVMSKLTFGRSEHKVGLTEIKTYSCLYLILDDLQTLLGVWKERTRHPAHFHYTQHPDVASRMKQEGTKYNMFLDTRFRRLSADNQDVVISSMCFYRLFKDEEFFVSMLTALRYMKNQVLLRMCPSLNGLIHATLPQDVWEAIWTLVINENKRVKHKFRLKVNIKHGMKQF